MTSPAHVFPHEALPISAQTPSRLLVSSACGVQILLKTTADLVDCLPCPLIPLPDDSAVARQVFFEFSQTRSADGRPVFAVAQDGCPVFASGDVAIAAHALESRVHLQIAARTDRAVFVHAGVLEWRGRALVIPGPSHSGKSTLVAALVAAGAAYYSDEYAVIGLDGRVQAFPRLLRLRPDVAATSSPAPISRPAASHPLPPLPLGWVLNLRYSPAGVWNPKPLSPGRALLALLENTVAVRRQSELTLRTLRLAVEPALGWQSERGEAAATAHELLRLVDQSLSGEAALLSGLTREGMFPPATPVAGQNAFEPCLPRIGKSSAAIEVQPTKQPARITESETASGSDPVKKETL